LDGSEKTGFGGCPNFQGKKAAAKSQIQKNGVKTGGGGIVAFKGAALTEDGRNKMVKSPYWCRTETEVGKLPLEGKEKTGRPPERKAREKGKGVKEIGTGEESPLLSEGFHPGDPPQCREGGKP